MANGSAVEQMRAHVGKRRAIVEANAVIKGQRLLLHLTLAMVWSLVVALVSLMGAKATSATCLTEPVELGLWFGGMEVLQVLSCWMFFILHCSVADLLSRSIAAGRTPAPSSSELAGEAVQAPAAAVVGHQSGSEPSPQTVSTQQRAPVAAHQRSSTLARHRPHPSSTVLTFSSLIMLVTGCLVFWCIFGILSALDAAGSAAKREACRQGDAFCWWLSILGLVQCFCCHFWAITDSHMPGNGPQPQPAAIGV